MPVFCFQHFISKNPNTINNIPKIASQNLNGTKIMSNIEPIAINAIPMYLKYGPQKSL